MASTVFKPLIYGIAIIVAFIAALVIFYQFDNRLFLFEARLMWPSTSFNAPSFRSGSSADKASMVVSIIRNKKFIGSKCGLVRAELGKDTGDYYVSDSNITYRLTNRGAADWMLTFVCGENGTINRVFIRKSCCSVSRKALYWIMDQMLSQ